ncbi:tyrosine-type recombinase/integrase [Candidatus Pelagibacter sp.]|jgi:integrase|uniref:tyrosine-type recombinase/integrase n=1 Tax=Candidatus Pelagibacter sp. TaxID=2024849 RepID=UPI003F8306A4|tara:strand:- start:205 stop:1545 length:1341 start_codon:yes stop_codon:yes gene_type:complete
MGKLTDAICRSLNRLDKKYYKPGNYPGVQFWVLTSGTKTWYYQYRTPNKKYPVSKRLGNYPHVGLVEAHKKAKQLAQNIFNGIYPEEQEKSDIMKMQLGEALKNYYIDELTEANRHRPSTIKNIKAIFKVWIFRNTYDKEILNKLLRADDIQYKKLSSITPKMFKNLFQIVGSKSPTTANRLQNYLRKFWNDYVKEADNPFLMKKKFMYDENVYLDFLDPTELKRVMKVLVQVDQRTGRLNKDYYIKRKLNPVSCLLLAFLLTTGRRTEEASSLTWNQYLKGDEPRIRLFETKTSKKNQKLIFGLGDDAVKVLNLILKDRLNNPDSRFYFPVNDPRNNCIFPSKDYGRKLANGKCKSLHIIDPDKTWDKSLKLGGVERHMKVYATRHTFATNFYRETRDIKALAEALGTTEEIALKYAKLVGQTVVDGINKIKFFDEDKVILKQVN